MKKIQCFFILVMSLMQLSVFSQRFSIEANYGLQGNFFVRNYDELDGPENKTSFYNKDFLGIIGGLQLNYHFKDFSSIFLGYSNSVNKGKKNYYENVNGLQLNITDFNLRHINNFFLLGYERAFTKQLPDIKYDIGLFMLTSKQQEIDVLNFSNSIEIQERKFKNSKMEEGGACLGLQYLKPIDTHFSLGMKLRGYYLISTNSMEAVSLTPVLRYHL